MPGKREPIKLSEVRKLSKQEQSDLNRSASTGEVVPFGPHKVIAHWPDPDVPQDHYILEYVD